MDNDLNKPEVSVLMPVFNAGKFLHEAIESILKQSFTHFELIIINDGSTDKSQQIIKSFTDNRIKYFKNDTNLGLIDSLNNGLQIACGKYIARMDADDIADFNRLRIQYDFMEKNPSVGVCGSWFEILHENKSKGVVKTYSNNQEIKCELIFSCPFAHPTVFIRKSILSSTNIHYERDFFAAEDYQLWARLANVSDFANIPQPLLKYRIHPEQVSEARKINQTLMANRIRAILLNEFFEISDHDFLQQHFYFSTLEKISTSVDFKNCMQWITTLICKNKKLLSFDERVLKQIALNRIRNIIYHSPFNIGTAFKFLTSSAVNDTVKNWLQNFKIILSVFLQKM